MTQFVNKPRSVNYIFGETLKTPSQLQILWSSEGCHFSFLYGYTLANQNEARANLLHAVDRRSRIDTLFVEIMLLKNIKHGMHPVNIH